MKNKKKLVVIGGGAAGFFCAVNAARMHKGMEVVVLEKSSKLLSKVKVSGGGRCNVTHDYTDVKSLLTHYPRGASFLKKAFHQFHTLHTIEWFSERGVTLKIEDDGRMFPITDDSQTIIDCLLEEARKYSVDIRMNAAVSKIIHRTSEEGNNLFIIEMSSGTRFEADYVCIACGGFPKMEQYSWIKELGHSIVDPSPSLFTFNLPGDDITRLMGITVTDVLVKIQGTNLQHRGSLLITHWGMSGPAILKLSSFGAVDLAQKKYEFNYTVNWLPEYNETSVREELQRFRFELASQKMANRNPFKLPSRLWEFLLAKTGLGPDIRWSDLPAKDQNKLAKLLCSQEFHAKGKTTFKEEFVTAGGVDTAQINPESMESRQCRGLYFAGEIMNVDGVTGGFNFQNAWTSGWLAAVNMKCE